MPAGPASLRAAPPQGLLTHEVRLAMEIVFSCVGLAPEPMFALQRQPERRLTVVDPVRAQSGLWAWTVSVVTFPVVRFPAKPGIPRMRYPNRPAPGDVRFRSSVRRRKGIAVGDESPIVEKLMARGRMVGPLVGISRDWAGEYDAERQ